MTAKKTTKSSPAPKKAAAGKKAKPAKSATPPAEEGTQTPEPASPAASSGTNAKPAKTKKPRNAKPKKVSALDAAAKVLAESGQSMNCKEMIEAMAAKGYWTSPGGKTPAQTLYAAILRETQAKGKDARFTKAQRGKFTLNGANNTTATDAGTPAKKSQLKPAKPAAEPAPAIPDGTPGPKSMRELFRLS